VSVASNNIRRIVTIEWPKAQERQAKAFLLRTARSGHSKIMADARVAGDEPDYEAYANSPGHRQLESVKLPGPIVYNYFYHRRMVAVALKALREASPPGNKYRNSHTLYVNGAPMVALPKNLKRTDVIFIANPRPYSRKLEVGKTESGRNFLVSVPNRIYERVTKDVLLPQFGKSAKISFGYITPPDAYKLVKNNKSRSWLANKQRWYYAPGQRADRAKGSAVQSPAIFIEMLT
jgi:hypothetical protein